MNQALGTLLLLVVVVTVLRQFHRSLLQMARDPDLRALLMAVVAVLLGGAFFFHDVEGWSFVDALFYCVVTLTTVGYGDLVPQTSLGRLFAIPYILLGLGVVGSFVGAMARLLLDQQRAGPRPAPAAEPPAGDR